MHCLPRSKAAGNIMSNQAGTKIAANVAAICCPDRASVKADLELSLKVDPLMGADQLTDGQKTTIRADFGMDTFYQRTNYVKITQSSHKLHHLRATFVPSYIDILTCIRIQLKRQFRPFHLRGPKAYAR